MLLLWKIDFIVCVSILNIVGIFEGVVWGVVSFRVGLVFKMIYYFVVLINRASFKVVYENYFII